jgi:hypothetical protein
MSFVDKIDNQKKNVQGNYLNELLQIKNQMVDMEEKYIQVTERYMDLMTNKMDMIESQCDKNAQTKLLRLQSDLET